MKTFVKLLLLLAVVSYLVFAFTRLTGGGDTTKCTEVNVVITDSIHAGFIDADEVKRLLSKAGLDPMGREMDAVNGEAIEKALQKNSFIKLVRCYKTPGGRVNIHVAQRLPILRVKADNGDDYYVDAAGSPMMPEHYTADLAVATGHISKDYARRRLVHLARLLHDNSFANDLVTQINVGRDGRVAIVPRIGCEVISLGAIDSTAIAAQFNNLQAFYAKVLPTVGWNTYREVSLEFANQIVCKKY